MSPPPPQIALIGATFWGNRGAEAMLCSTIGRVRESWPHAQFAVFSYYPSEDARLISDPQVNIVDARPLALVALHLPFALWGRLLRILRVPPAVLRSLLPPTVRALATSDLLLDVSGISFNDARLIFLPYKSLALWPAMLLGIPVIKLSQAMGPFRRLPNRLVARHLLSRCHRVFARGRETASFLENLGLPHDRWALAADLAFNFAPGDSLTIENPEKVQTLVDSLQTRRAAGESVVALSPSSLVYHKLLRSGTDYVGLLSQALREMLQAGHTICVLPNATRHGSKKARNNDLFVMARLRERLDADPPPDAATRLHWADFDLNTDGIRKLIAEADVLLTSRFHAMIAGLSLAIPTVVVGWSHKYKEVLDEVGCGDFAIDSEDIETQLAPTWRRALTERDDIRRRLEDIRPALKASSRAQFDCFHEILG